MGNVGQRAELEGEAGLAGRGMMRGNERRDPVAFEMILCAERPGPSVKREKGDGSANKNAR
jgi:hypothetical protein